MINELKLFLELKNQANELVDIRIFNFGRLSEKCVFQFILIMQYHLIF